jgi:Ca2+-binding EF-hand superfamily protein
MRDDVAGPDLQPSEFFELVNEVLSSHAGVASESEASPEPPSDSDLEACFTLADDDKSGKISEGEFVRLMGLIVEGGVKGLGSSSGGNHRSSSGLAPEHMKFKTDLRKAEAKDARNHALALSAEASAMALEAQKAARHAASERHKSNPPEMALGGAEQEWRKKFAEAANGGEGLDCTKFVLLVKKVLLKDFMQSQSSSSKSGGKITAGFDMPSDSDLDSAFSIADADESGIVDEGEFLRLMVLIRAGKIEGLGTSSFFSFGSSSAADKEASFKAEIEAAKAAVPSSVLDAELAAKAAAVKAKAAIAAAKLAESSAKAIQEKVANNGTNAAPQATGDVKVSAAFGSNEMKNSKDSVVTNSAAHNFGLGMHGPSSSKFGQNVTINTSSVIAQVDMTARDILSAQGVDLGHFVLPLHLHGVDAAEELKGCSNTWLAIHAELSAPAHLTKLRRVVADTTYSMPHTASDGFKGSTEAEIAAHEAKLRDLRQLASKDDASDRGPESKEVEGHESKLGKRLLASRGPVPKDSTNEVRPIMK